MDYSTEEWRAVPGYEGLYEVSDQGRVKSLKRPYVPQTRILSGPIPDQYQDIALSNCGKQRHVSLHVLIMEVFVGPCPEDMIVDHINHKKHDNRLENLQFITQFENVNRATDFLGLTNGVRARLTEQQVRALRAEWATGRYSYTEMAARYGVSYSTAEACIKRQTYKHID